MLLLDVARLREGSDPLERTIAPGDLAAEEDYRVVAPVVLEATVAKDKAKVRIVGHASTTLELACSRCLEGFEVPVDARFDLLYLPVSRITRRRGGRGPRGRHQHGVLPGRSHRSRGAAARAALSDAADEAIVPGQLPGLCPVCGVNRNVTTCSCEARWEDPRLAGLKALLKESDDA